MPRSLSSRIAFGTTFFMSLVLFANYNAALTSFLAVVKIQMPFEDMNDLYLKTDYQLVTVEETAYGLLLKSGSEIAQKIYKERLVLKSNMDEALELLQNRKAAFLWDHASLSAKVGKSCKVAKIETCYMFSPAVFSVKKGFPYNGIISYRYLRDINFETN